MPFKSKAQQKFLYWKHPEIAEEFSKKTSKSSYKKLPEYAKDKNHFKEYENKHRSPKHGR